MITHITATRKGKEYLIQVDESDYEVLSKRKWYLDHDGYAISLSKKERKLTNTKMHHLIVGKKEGLVVDHIDHNKLNNSRGNLRHITRQANAMNMKGVKGVYWNEVRKTYVVQIRVNAKTIHVGCSKLYEKAVELRKEAEEKYFSKHF